jgi:hypothetical protein
VSPHPADLTEHLQRLLADEPGGTRVVLVWDPVGRVLAADLLLDSRGQVWSVYIFDGDDAGFLRLWAARDRSRPALVLLRLRRALRPRPLDLSYQDSLLREAEDLIDLSLPAVLQRCTGVRWNEDAVHAVESLLIRDLRTTLDTLSALSTRGTLGIQDLRAVALATLVPGLRPDALLGQQPGDAAAGVGEYLALVARIGASARSTAQQFFADHLRLLPQAAPWLALEPMAALQAVYVAAVSEALGERVDSVRLRGLGVLSAEHVPSSLELWPALHRWLDQHPENAVVLDRGAELLGPGALDTVLAASPPVAAARLAAVFAALPAAAGERLLRGFLLRLPTMPAPLDELAAWAGPTNWASLDEPDAPPRGRLAAALTLLAAVVGRLDTALPSDVDLESLARVYLAEDLGTLEYDLAVAVEHLLSTEDGPLATIIRLLRDRVQPRVRATLARADARLAAAVGDSLTAYNHHPRSVYNLLRDEFHERGRRGQHPHVWLVVFDGMRWDTWARVLRPALVEAFEPLSRPEDEVRFALLPSITRLSRTALLACAAPDRWLTPQGTHTTDELQLGLLGFRLPPGDRAHWRLVKRGDEQLDSWLDPADARPYNTLIYNVSDDRIHHFGLDVAALNREIRNSLRDRIVRDLRTVVGDGDLILVTSDHGFIELDPGSGEDVDAPAGATVNYRYVEGARLAGRPSVDIGLLGTYTVALGDTWFRRPGGHAAKYAHGGLSFAELLVPGGVFIRSIVEALDVQWLATPPLLSVREGEDAQFSLTLVNRGNRSTRYRLQVSSEVAQLGRTEGELPVGGSEQVILTLVAPPGRQAAVVSGSFGVGSVLDRSLPAMRLAIEVAERTDRVEFNQSAFEMLDRLFED